MKTPTTSLAAFLSVCIALMSFHILWGQNTGDTVYTHVEHMPVFNLHGCHVFRSKERFDECVNTALRYYLERNRRYPKAAAENKITGKVTASFVVNKYGKTEQIRILKGLGYGCDEDIIRILESMNERFIPWIPGSIDGQAVAVLKTLSLKYEPLKFGSLLADKAAVREDKRFKNVFFVDEIDTPPHAAQCHINDDWYNDCTREIMEQQIKLHLKYPKDLVKYKNGGTATFRFIVSKDGKVKDPELFNSDDKEFGAAFAEALRRIIGKNIGWKAGIKEGKTVDTLIEYTLRYMDYCTSQTP